MVGSGLSGKDLHIDCLLQIVRESSKLFLSVSSPQWENARGYLFDPETRALCCPVSQKHLRDRSLDRYEVLIWRRPRLLVTGRLSSASRDLDAPDQIKLASARGMAPE